MSEVNYERTQWLRMLWWLLPLPVAALGWYWLSGAPSVYPSNPVLGWVLAAVLPATGLVMLGTLTVRVDDRSLRWHFGFIGWPRWHLALSDIAAVEVARTHWFEGAGIRFTREGRLYKAAGKGAVRITLHNGSRLRLGSDEPERLAAFIAARLAAH